MVRQAGLAPIRVCIFSPSAELCESLALEAKEAGYAVEEKFDQPKKLVEYIGRSSIDHIALIDTRRRTEAVLTLIEELCDKRTVAVVALESSVDCLPNSSALAAGAQALIVDPVNSKDVSCAFAVALYQHAKQSRMENKLDELQERLENRKAIEKAKGMLMKAAKVTEAEAFRLIQKQSQDKRKSMADIAASIIATNQLVEEASRGRGD
jgi:AmiR/NasT family two-component response regulator